MRNFAILIFCFIAYITIQAQDLYFKHLGIPDGLSQVCIHTIFQDEFGAVWIGTSEGLNRYNGNNVLAFPLTNAEKKIFNSNIGRISGNRNGTLSQEVTKRVYFIGNERMLIAHDSNRLRFS